jgi:hypothetical protein
MTRKLMMYWWRLINMESKIRKKNGILKSKNKL